MRLQAFPHLSQLAQDVALKGHRHLATVVRHPQKDDQLVQELFFQPQGVPHGFRQPALRQMSQDARRIPRVHPKRQPSAASGRVGFPGQQADQMRSLYVHIFCLFTANDVLIRSILGYI